ncbi:MAG: diguanylate cyclase [Candidatus Eremiobacteraeota bacterium]|nr:diguanylate cyclase [Candidatus Eremiobacteraeota bacterium]
MDKVEVDKLTKLYNEQYLKVGLEQELLRAKRFGRELSLLLLAAEIPAKVKQDMQYRVLKQLGNFVKMYTRSIDVGVRYGDCVLVILPETPLEGARRAGEKVKEQIEKHIFVHHDSGYEFNVKVTVKIAVYPHNGGDRAELLEFLKENESTQIIEPPPSAGGGEESPAAPVSEKA